MWLICGLYHTSDCDIQAHRLAHGKFGINQSSCRVYVTRTTTALCETSATTPGASLVFYNPFLCAQCVHILLTPHHLCGASYARPVHSNESPSLILLRGRCSMQIIDNKAHVQVEFGVHFYTQSPRPYYISLI